MRGHAARARAVAAIGSTGDHGSAGLAAAHPANLGGAAVTRSPFLGSFLPATKPWSRRRAVGVAGGWFRAAGPLSSETLDRVPGPRSARRRVALA
jgi:hypothetical protein